MWLLYYGHCNVCQLPSMRHSRCWFWPIMLSTVWDHGPAHRISARALRLGRKGFLWITALANMRLVVTCEQAFSVIATITLVERVGQCLGPKIYRSHFGVTQSTTSLPTHYPDHMGGMDVMPFCSATVGKKYFSFFAENKHNQAYTTSDSPSPTQFTSHAFA